MTNDAVLSISDLSVHYELARGTSAEALSGAHLDVGRGRVHGLVGGSGSGKSSLIKAVLGLSAHNARVSGRIDFAAPVTCCGAPPRSCGGCAVPKSDTSARTGPVRCIR